MVEFLDTNATSSELSKMVSNSKERLYLISPYLQMSDKIKILILQAEKASPKIEIKLLYRSDKNKELNDKDTDFLLKQLNNAKVYVLENLHAKCYLNENTAIITSMNLYQHSQENNWETGIKIDKLIDPIVYEDINRHICLLFNVSKRLETNQNNFGSVISQFNDTCTKTKKDDKIAAPNNGYLGSFKSSV